MIKLWEAVVGNFFLGNKFVLNRYKTLAVSVSNTDKQQFTANQSIHQLSTKDRSVRMKLNCDIGLGLVYRDLLKNTSILLKY